MAFAGGALPDPYLIPGTRVLRNRVGARDKTTFDHAEADLVPRRAALRRAPRAPPFDLDHLRAIHRWLFQDLFDWAGQTRRGDYDKGGTQFWPSDSLETRATKVFALLRTSPLMDPAVRDDPFAAHISVLYLDLNHLHPFREGNGRAQRAFLNDVAWVSGRAVDWSVISRSDNDKSSRDAVLSQSAAHLRRLLEPAIVKVADEAQWRAVATRELQIVRSATAWPRSGPPPSTAASGALSAAEASAAGRPHGSAFCRVCGRRLRSADSIARGYGPSCARRMTDG